MKELWFIFLIGVGLACLKFSYLLIKKYKINRVQNNNKFSRILQTFATKNFQIQRTYTTGNKRMSLFQDMKKNSKMSNDSFIFISHLFTFFFLFFQGYLNHEPRAILDSRITFNICALLIDAFKNYKDALQKEEYRNSMFKAQTISTTNFEEKKKFTKSKTNILFNNSEGKGIEKGYQAMVEYFKSVHFNDDAKKEDIRKCHRLLRDN